MAIGFIGGVNQGEFFSSHLFMHYSYESHKTEWSLLNHKKENKNLHLRVTCTLWIENPILKHIGSVKVVHVRCLIATHNGSEFEAGPTKEHNHFPGIARIEVISLISTISEHEMPNFSIFNMNCLNFRFPFKIPPSDSVPFIRRPRKHHSVSKKRRRIMAKHQR